MFFDNFVRLCEQKGVKPSRALTEAGVPKSAYSYWEPKQAQGTMQSRPTKMPLNLRSISMLRLTTFLLATKKKTRPSSRKAKSMQQWIGLEESLNLCRRNSVKR